MYPLYKRLIIQTEAAGTETIVEFNNMSYRISGEELNWIMVSVYLDGAATTDKIKISLPGVDVLDYVYVNNEEITNLSSFCSSYNNESGSGTVYIEFTVGKVLSYPDSGSNEYKLHIVASGTHTGGGSGGGGTGGGGSGNTHTHDWGEGINMGPDPCPICGEFTTKHTYNCSVCGIPATWWEPHGSCPGLDTRDQ